jgi:hypothetical protein
VAELHQLGYERARIVPFIVDTAGGGDWHCVIAPAAMISATCGADIDPRIQWWRGESPPGRDFPYFIGRGWRLFLPGVSSAKNLVRGFPRLAEQCVGCDGEYVEWYLSMLQKTAPEGVVYANAYWDDDKCPGPKLKRRSHQWMRAFDADGELEVRVPVPPPGRASP